jgi:hypothetical protein
MKPLPMRDRLTGRSRRQSGLALMVMLVLMAIYGLYLFVGQISTSSYPSDRAQNAADALAEAKQALIGDAISRPLVSDAGYLRLPDLGTFFGAPTEGQASGTFSGGSKDFTAIGKFPWKTLATPPLRDRDKECLWYVVSGRFKITPPTDALNWDTQGQIDLIDGQGTVIAANLAALLVAPGTALDGQSRALADAAYEQCGGNYDARNYLDAFDSANAIAGEVNYFAASTNHRVAVNSNNKRFVRAGNAHFNDSMLYVTADEIFNSVIKRGDFAVAVASLLSHPIFQTIPITGNKGTDSLDCSSGGGLDQVFCENWRQMLFLTQLLPPSPITIDGTTSGTCSRVLLFGGRRIAGQNRGTGAEIANKLNYLEGNNASSFSTPTTTTANFNGASNFDWHNAGVDLVRCIP